MVRWRCRELFRRAKASSETLKASLRFSFCRDRRPRRVVPNESSGPIQIGSAREHFQAHALYYPSLHLLMSRHIVLEKQVNIMRFFTGRSFDSEGPRCDIYIYLRSSRMLLPHEAAHSPERVLAAVTASNLTKHSAALKTLASPGLSPLSQQTSIDAIVITWLFGNGHRIRGMHHLAGHLPQGHPGPYPR